MDLYLREIEPTAAPRINQDEVALFLKHLTGSELISAEFKAKPKCWMVYHIKYKYTGHSFAIGPLFSISIDQIEKMLPDFAKKYIVGKLEIQLGENNNNLKITPYALS